MINKYKILNFKNFPSIIGHPIIIDKKYNIF